MNGEERTKGGELTGDVPGVRFEVKAMFLLTLVCAVAVTLVRELGLGGTVAIFVGAALASLIIRRRCDPPTRRFWLQSIWGILLPLACLATDPFLFVNSVGLNIERLTPITIGCYVFMAWQMAALVGSWFLTPSNCWLAAPLAGTLLAGAIFAACVGLALLPFTVIFTIFLIGLPGVTPWITMMVYSEACRHCWRMAAPNGDSRRPFRIAGAGFVMAVLVGLAAAVTWEIALDDLLGRAQRVAPALEADQLQWAIDSLPPED